ncbi:hypothetical protein BDY24DRAFT_228431 [Mrakia frigida]|uniref:ubiquitin-protein ligase SAN1 n=1 Tax=Mrakia frigida TaxID=29902 RepID=UPI003FCBFC26
MPSPIQISPSSYHPAPFIDDATGLSQSMSTMGSGGGGGGMRSPTSPRPSFLPSFMRRPRAATSDSTTRPPLHPQLVEGGTNVAPPSTSHQPSSFHFTTNGGPPPSPQPIPSSSESLPSPSTPPNHTSSRRRTNPASSPGAGGLPSPPLSSSHQPDPLAGFGHRLLRRISNQGGSSSSSNTASPASLRPTSAGTGGGRSSSTPPPAAPSNAVGAAARRAEGEGLELQRESPRGEHARELLSFWVLLVLFSRTWAEEETKGKNEVLLPSLRSTPF